jgi:ABC-type molybdate transport system substrate-binding protein
VVLLVVRVAVLVAVLLVLLVVRSSSIHSQNKVAVATSLRICMTNFIQRYNKQSQQRRHISSSSSSSSSSG